MAVQRVVQTYKFRSTFFYIHYTNLCKGALQSAKDVTPTMLLLFSDQTSGSAQNDELDRILQTILKCIQYNHNINSSKLVSVSWYSVPCLSFFTQVPVGPESRVTELFSNSEMDKIDFSTILLYSEIVTTITSASHQCQSPIERVLLRSAYLSSKFNLVELWLQNLV